MESENILTDNVGDLNKRDIPVSFNGKRVILYRDWIDTYIYINSLSCEFFLSKSSGNADSILLTMEG
jgi:hypothetical protein